MVTKAYSGPGPEAALDDWRGRVAARGRAMLTAAALLSDYLALEEAEASSAG
ncbi:hypothetical protein [Streptomyces roseolus]